MSTETTAVDRNIFLDLASTENREMPGQAQLFFEAAVNSKDIPAIGSETSLPDDIAFDNSFNLGLGKRKYSIEEFIPKLKFDFKNYFSKTQKWIGHIIEIKEDVFIAQLEDITHGGTYEIGEFEKADVSPGDTELMQIGAVFYWSVGKESRNGQIINQSFIRFQRLPNWSEEQYDKAIDSANDLLRDLKWD